MTTPKPLPSDDILFFSSDDWGWKTSKYHISTRLAQQGKVLFVSSIGFRAPTASSEDLGRIWRKLKSFFKGTREVMPNLHVLTPLVIPFKHFPGKNWLNRGLLKIQVKIAMHKLGMQNPLLFVFSQNWLPYIRSIERKKCIYYAVDEQSSFKGLDAAQFNAWDHDMCQLADGIFCTSKTLYLEKQKLNPKTVYMPHGVDFDNFFQTWSENTTVAPSISCLAKPCMLFFGHISHDWVDAELLKGCAALRPTWSWVLVGRNSMKANEFQDYPNIHYLGEHEFQDLPSFCKGADVGLIPFVRSTLTENCNPLKLPEYVTAGLPVVSTPIPSVSELYPDDALIAETAAAFVAACEQALQRTKADLKVSAEMMRAHSWDERLARILRHIREEF